MRKAIIIIYLFTIIQVHAQEQVSIDSDNVTLYGTRITPEQQTDYAVLIIAGSGPTDRDGNSVTTGIKTDALKKLAESLTEKGLVTLRYDKRGVGESVLEQEKKDSIQFEDFVRDAEAWINYLANDYQNVTVIGHSQGALVGLLAAANTKVDKLISLAGMNEDFYTTLKRQLKEQPIFVSQPALPILDSLKKGIKTDSVPPILNTIFHPSLQDYLLSFMKYDPQKIAANTNLPLLIIQGSNDLQVTAEGARELHEASPYSKLVILDSMNHVLKVSAMERNSNLSTYNQPDLPLHNELIPAITEFIHDEKWYYNMLHLVGTWKIEGKEKYEAWEFDQAEEHFIGESYKISEGKKIHLETLEISTNEHDIMYHATVPTQNNGRDIAFPLQKLSRHLLSFENKDHDFPKKIQYQRINNSKIKVRVLGENDEGYEITMIKIK